MLRKSILEINFNPIYFSYLSGLVIWGFLISISYIIENSDILGCDTMSLDEGPTIQVSVSGWRSTLLMKWLQWRHVVSQVFHIFLFAHILGKCSSNLCCRYLKFVTVDEWINILQKVWATRIHVKSVFKDFLFLIPSFSQWYHYSPHFKMSSQTFTIQFTVRTVSIELHGWE
jgi:hypothetical protein